MSSLESTHIDGLRPYIYDYTIGLLWIAGALVVMLDESRLLSAASLLSKISQTMEPARVPDVAASLAVLIAGVILPYCVQLALSPLSLFGMFLFVTFDPFTYTARRRSERTDLGERATKLITTQLGISRPIDVNARLPYITAAAPSLMPRLRRAQHEGRFLVGSVLPLALLFGAGLARITAPLGSAASLRIAVVGTLSILVAGVLRANATYRDFLAEVDLAVLLAASERKELSATHPNNALQPRGSAGG